MPSLDSNCNNRDYNFLVSVKNLKSIYMQNVINFDNTKNAFQSKTNSKLKKAQFIFTIIDKAWLVKIAKPTTNFLLRTSFPIAPILKHTVFEQFCGGETIVACQSTVDELFETGGVYSILDYSVEGKLNEKFFDETLQSMIEVCNHAKNSKTIPFLVFKPTGLGRFELFKKKSANIPLTQNEVSEWDKIILRFNVLCETVASTNHLKIMIDAEESWLQNAVDHLTEEMMVKYNKQRAVIFTSVQMYRWDRLSYLEYLNSFGYANNIKIGVKLVRGAYMEKERERAKNNGYRSPICPEKKSTDENFNNAISYVIKHLEVFNIFVGTHNETSCLQLINKMVNNGLTKSDSRIWFGQLYGMSDNISFNLAANGYNTAKYIPFGSLKEVIPYLFRRAEENTSVGTQTSRELTLIRQEIKRRKASRL